MGRPRRPVVDSLVGVDEAVAWLVQALPKLWRLRQLLLRSGLAHANRDGCVILLGIFDPRRYRTRWLSTARSNGWENAKTLADVEAIQNTVLALVSIATLAHHEVHASQGRKVAAKYSQRAVGNTLLLRMVAAMEISQAKACDCFCQAVDWADKEKNLKGKVGEVLSQAEMFLKDVEPRWQHAFLGGEVPAHNAEEVTSQVSKETALDKTEGKTNAYDLTGIEHAAVVVHSSAYQRVLDCAEQSRREAAEGSLVDLAPESDSDNMETLSKLRDQNQGNALQNNSEIVLAAGLAAENARLKAELEASKACESQSTSELHSLSAELKRFCNEVTSELHSLSAELKRFRNEVVVFDVEAGTEEVAHVDVLDPPAKRQRMTERAGAAFASHLADHVKVKKEKAEKAAGELEDAQETLGFVIQSENNKMSEIDALKAEVARLNAEIAILKAPSS